MAWALLYLHGVGDAVRNDAWYDSLHSSLERHGIEVPPRASSRIIAPDYVELLKFPPAEGGSAPTRTVKDTSPKDEALTRRAEYARRQARSVSELTGTVDSRGLRNIAGGIDLARVPLPRDLRDSRHYLRNEALRRAVLHRVLGSLGGHRDLVVVGHSLGSLVAIDLLRHLPPGVRIRRLVTFGSPAGVLGLWKSLPFQRDDFPFHQVEGWINVLNPFDVITRGAGVNRLFPAAADVRIQLGASHSAAMYLGHPVAGQVLAEVLRPPRTQISDEKALEVALSAHETDQLDALAFAHLVGEQMTPGKEKTVRVRLALQGLRERTGRAMRLAREERGEPMPAMVSVLESGDEPEFRFSHRPLEEQLFFAVLMATSNPLAPYDVDLAAEHLAAVEALWTAYGYTRPEAKRVATAVRESAGQFSRTAWHRHLMGDTILGSTRVSSMLGEERQGLVTPLTPTDQVRSQVLRLTAFTEAHRSLDLPGDRTAGWMTLQAWSSEIAAHLNDLEAVSDPGSATVKELKARLQIIAKALAWLDERGLLPEEEPLADDEVRGELV
ncbi:alpha/beta hydrolase [Nocardioides yefusunii]|uniref:Alpha/beta hydrolase n=1 Tax=Nocardioides yefusunii TaxID=2500546 RepID=A0ABW1R1B8_9ACTN|nr:alpha/beta hydrolase [Nocardioides yefusunii]